MDRDRFFLFLIPKIMVPFPTQPLGLWRHQQPPELIPNIPRIQLGIPGAATLPKAGEGWQKFPFPLMTVDIKITGKLSTLIP